jgi:hypothetical protein
LALLAFLSLALISLGASVSQVILHPIFQFN